MTLKVLVVEDDREIRGLLQSVLALEGFEVRSAVTLSEARALLEHQPPDVVILDLGLPDGDGGALVAACRGRQRLPVIVVSARQDEAQKVALLDAGADDYLVKPFSVGELMARVRAALRRHTGGGTQPQSVLAFGDCEIDFARRSVRRDGQHVHLTPVEYKLLAALAGHEGQVLTHRHLLRDVWGPGSVEHSHYLRIYMGHLRRKLETDPAQPLHLLTETGVGYRFIAQTRGNPATSVAV